MTTERIQKQETHRITLSLSEENIKDLDHVASILPKKASGKPENRSGANKFLISIGTKLLQMNRFHSGLQAGADLFAILKELSYVPQNTLKPLKCQHKS